MAILRGGLLLLFLLSLSFFGSVSAHFMVEKNIIQVRYPGHIRGKYDGAIADYGIPEHGGSMVGVVQYPDQGTKGCYPFRNISFKSQSRSPVFVLLDPGNCYFVLKAWHAQNAGAAAVLIANNIDQPLITMHTPQLSYVIEEYKEKITIPSVLIDRAFGKALKRALGGGSQVSAKLEWNARVAEVLIANNIDEPLSKALRRALGEGSQLSDKLDSRKPNSNPAECVKYELWGSINDECGPRCDEQMDFIKNFKKHAKKLEKGGYTMFTPHYETWYCPAAFVSSIQCELQCINNGRYCAPDPEQDFSRGYDGKDVVLENLRQLCVHRVAKESNRAWIWWDFATKFSVKCSMKEGRYSKACAEDVTKLLGLPLEKIAECMGNLAADVENPVLKAEQARNVTILPTLIINQVQYQGKLEKTAVLKAICAAFKASTNPPICSDI